MLFISVFALHFEHVMMSLSICVYVMQKNVFHTLFPFESALPSELLKSGEANDDAFLFLIFELGSISPWRCVFNESASLLRLALSARQLQQVHSSFAIR